MKTKFLLIAIAIIGLALNSCSSDEKTIGKYIIDVNYAYSPVTQAGEDIAKAITTYQFEQGYFSRVYTVTIDKLDVSIDELDKKAAKIITTDLSKTDYMEAVRKAGLEMTTNVAITYSMKYEFDKNNPDGRSHYIRIEYLKP